MYLIYICINKRRHTKKTRKTTTSTANNTFSTSFSMLTNIPWQHYYHPRILWWWIMYIWKKLYILLHFLILKCHYRHVTLYINDDIHMIYIFSWLQFSFVGVLLSLLALELCSYFVEFSVWRRDTLTKKKIVLWRIIFFYIIYLSSHH